jgi:glycosyltransferase involved in cell wall biosynthesis
MLSSKITVCIFAWNEAQRILRCIENFKGLFDILVVDNCSSDTTFQVVRDAGYRAVTIKNPGFFETDEVMRAVCEACTTDYVLIASVSEFIPLALLQRYAEVANGNTHDVVRAFRESITAGQAIPISGSPSMRVPGELRFFKKGSVDYLNNKVHDRGTIMVPSHRVLNLVTDRSAHFYQFRDYDCSHTETVLCRYDDLLAKQRYDAGQRFSWIRAIYHSGKTFLVSYLGYGSLRFGMLGFLHCYYRGHMEFTVWLRLWEREHGYTRAEVIQRNKHIRQQMETEFREAGESNAGSQLLVEERRT